MDTSDNDYGVIDILIEDNKNSIVITIQGENFNQTQQFLLSKINDIDFTKLRSTRNKKYSLINKDIYNEIRAFIHSLPKDGIVITDEAYRLEQVRTARATAATTVSAFADEFAGISGFGDLRTVENKASDLALAQDMIINPKAPLIPGISQRDPNTREWLPRGYKKGQPYFGGKKTKKRRRNKKSRKGKSKKRYSRRR